MELFCKSLGRPRLDQGAKGAGRPRSNQDACCCLATDAYSLLAVADGAGSLKNSGIAASLAVSTLPSLVAEWQWRQNELWNTETLTCVANGWASALNKRILACPEQQMATTLTAALLPRVGPGWLLWAGDSPALKLSRGQIIPLNWPHYEDQRPRDAWDATLRPSSLCRYLGSRGERWRPDLISFTLQRGEILLLASDGAIPYNMPAETLLRAASLQPEQAIDYLMEQARALGSRDDQTICYARR